MDKLISVITPSLNHGRFLPETIASIKAQNYPNVEHIVVDGGSTDNTVDILKASPWIRWVSESERNIVDAYRKAIGMAQGEYVVQCCISDGFLDPAWFATCAEILDSQPDVSLVWGLPRYMSEEGVLGAVAYGKFQGHEPPQKMAFLPFWLASGFVLPEGNYCLRREVLDECFPHYAPDDPFSVNPHLSFNYDFHAKGYLPYFVPVVANFGRLHGDQRQKKNQLQETIVFQRYLNEIARLRAGILSGKRAHVFKSGTSQPIRAVDARDIRRYRRHIVRYRCQGLVERLRASYRYRVGRVLRLSAA